MNGQNPNMDHEKTSQELFSNKSVAMCLLVKLLPGACQALGLPILIAKSTWLLGKIVFVPVQILLTHQGSKEYFQAKHPKMWNLFKKCTNFCRFNQVQPVEHVAWITSSTSTGQNQKSKAKAQEFKDKECTALMFDKHCLLKKCSLKCKH